MLYHIYKILIILSVAVIHIWLFYEHLYMYKPIDFLFLVCVS